MNFTVCDDFTIVCNICGQSQKFSPLDRSLLKFAANHAKCTIAENEKLFQIKMRLRNPQPSQWMKA